MLTLHEEALSYSNDALAADVEPAVATVSGLRYMGFSIRESDGTPAVATVAILNGATVAGGARVEVIELAANESKNQWYGPNGIRAADGITIDHIAGTVDIVIYYQVALAG